MKPTRAMICMSLLLAAAWPCAGQDELYHVEVIVFEHDSASDPLYRWPGEPATEGALALWPEADASRTLSFSDRRAGNAPLRPLDTVFVALSSEHNIMQPEWRKLSAAGEFRPLVQRAWRQPAAPFGDPQPVLIQGGEIVYRPAGHQADLLMGGAPAQPVYEVTGAVAFERGRFLHLRIDLAFNTRPRGSQPHSGDFETLQRPAQYQSFRIRERRQVTTGAVNYFDHRHFGVIALVKEYSPQDPDAATTASAGH